jgi:gluconate 2-dehydrogenase gamma chain
MQFFTPKESRDIAAIAERIFPGGPDRPGAGDIHVLEYIDGQLAGDWGLGAGMYTQGPFVTPIHAGHGCQLNLTPAESYRQGLAALDQYCNAEFERSFADLSTNEQETVLEQMVADRLPTFVELPASVFFSRVRQNVIEGLFSDPTYGGNHDLLGWRWVGYPGVASAHADDYSEFIDRYSDDYSPEPRSLP